MEPDPGGIAISKRPVTQLGSSASAAQTNQSGQTKPNRNAARDRDKRLSHDRNCWQKEALASCSGPTLFGSLLASLFGFLVCICAQVMRPGRKRATKEQTHVWQTGSSSDTCSGPTGEILIRFLKNHMQVSSQVVLEAHDI